MCVKGVALNGYTLFLQYMEIIFTFIMSIIVFLVIGYFVIIYTQSKEEYYINCNIILVFCIIFKCQYDIIIFTILISGIVTLYCIIPSIGNNNDDDILD